MLGNTAEHLQILDCTLRDGSYAVNFQFTALDTADICRGLDRIGIPLIEVGHGVGLGASEKGMGRAAETDEAYLEAAAANVKRAKFGAFSIPGIATLDDIDMAAGLGMGFIRIGTNVTEVECSEPYIARAKKHGMYVTANFMKSYATPAEEFAQKALLSEKYGSDAVYLVDSAGGMLSSDVLRYIHAVQDVSEIPLGFHGHNNLGLAVAHAIEAVSAGVTIIDTTLQGLGRSSGNVPTEILALVLLRMGIEVGLDPLEVIDLGEQYVKPLIRSQGLDALDIIGGYAQFHSSYMGIVRKFSTKHRVDPRKLIIELCAVDKVNAPEELVDTIAQKLRDASSDVPTARFRWDKYFGEEQK
jgi:4-hydroxy-2-oxovalerate aldolase